MPDYDEWDPMDNFDSNAELLNDPYGYNPYNTQEFLNMFGITGPVATVGEQGIDYYTPHGIEDYEGVDTDTAYGTDYNVGSLSELPGNITDNRFLFYHDPDAGPSSRSGGEHQWNIFDLGAWMEDYSEYIPLFDPQNIKDLRERSESEYERETEAAFDTAHAADLRLRSNIYDTSDDILALRENLYDTSRMGLMESQGEERGIRRKYEADLAGAWGDLAGLGAFDMGDTDRWADPTTGVASSIAAGIGAGIGGGPLGWLYALGTAYSSYEEQSGPPTAYGDSGIGPESYSWEIDDNTCTVLCGDNNSICYDSCMDLKLVEG